MHGFFVLLAFFAAAAKCESGANTFPAFNKTLSDILGGWEVWYNSTGEGWPCDKRANIPKSAKDLAQGFREKAEGFAEELKYPPVTPKKSLLVHWYAYLAYDLIECYSDTRSMVTMPSRYKDHGLSFPLYCSVLHDAHDILLGVVQSLKTVYEAINSLAHQVPPEALSDFSPANIIKSVNALYKSQKNEL